MVLPFIHATGSFTPESIDIRNHDKNKIILSQYRTFDHALVSDVLSMKYVVEGVEEYIVDGKVYRVGPGQFILVTPESDVQVAWSSPDLVTGVCLYFDPGFANDVLAEDTDLAVPTGIHLADRRLHSWFSSYRRGVSEGDEAWWIGASMTRSLYEENKIRHSRILKSRPDTRKALIQAIHDTCVYLDLHPQHPFSLDELAARVYMSKFHFLRVFRQIAGITPQQYHQNARFRKACELLKEPGVQIQEVAWEIGYHEVAAFSKFFRKMANSSPSQWRYEELALNF